MISNFEKDLEKLINKHSMENDSNTPDFILAQYLKGCLDNFGNTLKARDKWYGVRDELYQTDIKRQPVIKIKSKQDRQLEKIEKIIDNCDKMRS